MRRGLATLVALALAPGAPAAPAAAGVAAVLRTLWADPAAPVVADPAAHAPTLAVYLAARDGGKRLAQAWGDGGTLDSAARAAVGYLRDRVTRRGHERLEWVDTLEVFVAERASPVTSDAEWEDLLHPRHHGVLGFQAGIPGFFRGRYSPTRLYASNRRISKQLRLFAESKGLSPTHYRADLEVRALHGPQYLVPLDPAAPATRMFRGNQVVTQGEVTRAAVLRMADLGLGWLLANMDPSGRLTYKYWPASGRESTSNNMIRQWMASVALARAAAREPGGEVRARAAANIEYNLTRFYREVDGLGRIEYVDKVKLGAVALAALAIAEHPDRARWAAPEAALRRTVLELWNEDGRFDTHLVPRDMGGNENFYPGEALLYWGTLLARGEAPELAARMTTSFRYYRTWHLDPANRNPAFVPWHTQAYRLLYATTKDPALLAFVYETNDWLVGYQQVDAPFPDQVGRFYDPDRTHFGPPHASSTGVYLEGLIDAFAMAREAGDTARADAYRRAILRGLRHLMQLQYVDEVDTYAVSRKDRVLGGLRTSTRDDTIRCDNIQHGLMGMRKILATFQAGDWALDPPAAAAPATAATTR